MLGGLLGGAGTRPNQGPIGARAQLLAIDRVPFFTGRALDPWAVPGRHLNSLVEPVVDVSSLNILPSSLGDCRLATKHGDGLAEGFLGGHARSCSSKLVCILEANSLADKGRKLSCVETLGELVKEWRRQSGLSRPQLAELIRSVSEDESQGSKVQRQHIDQLEMPGVNRRPRYIAELAKAMGASVDDLLALRMPPPLRERGKAAAHPPPPPRPPRDFSDRMVVSETDFGLLQDIKIALSSEEIAEIRRKAALIAERAADLIEARKQEAASASRPKHMKGADATMAAAPSKAAKEGHRGGSR